MRRPERNTARVLTLAIAGALLFVVGYFAGSRYASPPFQGLNAVVLTEAPMLSSLADIDLRPGWQLIAIGQADARDCRALRLRMTQIHNRLAKRRDLQEALVMTFVGAHSGRNSNDVATVPRLVSVSADQAQALAGQLGYPSGASLDCGEIPFALVDPSGRLRALLPASGEPATSAKELAQLLEQLKI